MERFFRSLKNEWIPVVGYVSFSEAAHAITDYIVGYYSALRPHEYNGGLPPNESENRYWKNSNSVASFCWPLQKDENGAGIEVNILDLIQDHDTDEVKVQFGSSPVQALAMLRRVMTALEKQANAELQQNSCSRMQ